MFKKAGLFFLTLCLISLIFPTNVSAKETVTIPDDVKEYCEKYAEEYDLSPYLLMSICWQETRCRANLENAGCKGMCQISERYHKGEMELLGLDDLFDAEQNIHLCAYIVKQLSDKNSDEYYILMCYNCGSGRGKKLYKQGVRTKYAKTVIANSEYLREVYENEKNK